MSTPKSKIESVILTLQKDSKKFNPTKDLKGCIDLFKEISEIKDKVELEALLSGSAFGSLKCQLGVFRSHLLPPTHEPERQKWKVILSLTSEQINELVHYLDLFYQNLSCHNLQNKLDSILPSVITKLKSMQTPIHEAKAAVETKELKELKDSMDTAPSKAKRDKSALKGKAPFLVLIDTNIYNKSEGATKPKDLKTVTESFLLTNFNKGLDQAILQCGAFRHLVTDVLVVECSGVKYDQYFAAQDHKKKAEQDEALKSILLFSRRGSKDEIHTKDSIKEREKNSIPMERYGRLIRPECHLKHRSNITVSDFFTIVKNITAEDIRRDFDERPDIWVDLIATKRWNSPEIIKYLNNLLEEERKSLEESAYNIGSLGLGDMLFGLNALIYNIPIITANIKMIDQFKKSSSIIIRFLFSKVNIIVPNYEKDTIEAVISRVEDHYLDRTSLQAKADRRPALHKIGTILKVMESGLSEEEIEKRLKTIYLRQTFAPVTTGARVRSASDAGDSKGGAELEEMAKLSLDDLSDSLDETLSRHKPLPEHTQALQGLLSFSLKVAPATLQRRGSFSKGHGQAIGALEGVSLQEVCRTRTNPTKLKA